MGLLRKKNNGVDDDSGAVSSILGKELQLEGDISFKGKLRLDGRITGNVRGDYLIMGENGVVVGDVLVNTFVCLGKVDGNVNAQKFQISSCGVINGKVESSDLTVESGATLNGEIKSRNKEESQQAWDAQVKNAATGAAAGRKAADAAPAQDKTEKTEKTGTPATAPASG